MYPLSDGLFAAKNQWYIAAWSNEVSREPMERWILEEPIALYRKENGEAVALQGRCPHRGFPLGKSRVAGDNIQCGYHGITFQPDGNCAGIPTQLAIPQACKVKSYPLVEQWKWLWIWMGDPTLADTRLIPTEEELGVSANEHLMAIGGYTLVSGRYMLLHDNLFDLTHIGYLHMPNIGAGGGEQNTVPAIETGENWISSLYTQRDVNIPQYFSEMLKYTGKVDRIQGLKLFLPCLHVGGTQIFLPRNEDGTQGKPLGSLRVLHGITPATHHSAHYFFASGQSWSDDPAVSRQIFDNNRRTTGTEDVMATEYIEQMIQKNGGRLSEVLVKADVVCMTGRRMFEKIIRAEMRPETVARESLVL